MVSIAYLLVAVAAALAECASRTTAPAGALVVGPSATYTKVQDAVDALSTTSTDAQALYIEAGVYNEQVYIPARAAQLTVYGETTDTLTYSGNQATITYNLGLGNVSTDDETATVRNWAANSTFYNINIANTGGKSANQALALSAYAGNQGYYGVQLTGYQDTLLSQTGAQVYAQSYISGATDFIFGQHATTWFDAIDIRVLNASVGYVTANGRPSTSDPSIYVINNSTIAAAANLTVTPGAFYLGRPWSQYARVVFQQTSMTNVINSAGWAKWTANETAAQLSTVTFEEYDNTGAGSQGIRANFSSEISAPIAIADVLGSGYESWVDTSYLS